MADADKGGIQLNTRTIAVVLAITVFYLLLSVALVGFKTDQLFLAGIFNAAFFLSPVSRKLILGFSIFVVYWIIFDYMKAFPNYNYNTVHMADLYGYEKSLFGIHINGQILTPNEYFKLHSTTFLDVMSGIFYLCWIPVPFGFGVYLFIVNRRECLYFLISFVVINILEFIIYYAYPAAPPWYVQDYGFVLHPHMHENKTEQAQNEKKNHTNIFR